MKRIWLARLLCFALLVTLCTTLGCNAFTARRQRRREYAIETNLDRMVDDVDWMLGLDAPTQLYDETMR